MLFKHYFCQHSPSVDVDVDVAVVIDVDVNVVYCSAFIALLMVKRLLLKGFFCIVLFPYFHFPVFLSTNVKMFIAYGCNVSILYSSYTLVCIYIWHICTYIHTIFRIFFILFFVVLFSLLKKNVFLFWFFFFYLFCLLLKTFLLRNKIVFSVSL